MKRGQKFLIGLASAILTFSVLFATVGKPRHFDKHHSKTECTKVSPPNSK